MAGEAVTVKVLGYPELMAGSATLFARIDEAADDAFQEVAADVAGQVRGNLPQQTGRLAGSVESRGQGDGALVQMGEGVRYAEYVEYGGRGHPHNPQGTYLYPTAMKALPVLVAAGVEAAEDEIGRMRWPTPS